MRRWSLLLPLVLALLAACDSIEDVFVHRSPGEKLWRKHCAECHGLDAAGNTVRSMGNGYADLRDETWKSGGDPGSIENVIRQGIFGQMPAQAGLSDEEVRQIIDYLYKLRGETRGGS